jgi:phenylacetate-coenzyme A ligase PaaK-like adenylate-forming protein
MKEYKIKIINKEKDFEISYKVDAENEQQAQVNADNQIKQVQSKLTGKLTAKIEEELK